MRIATLESFQMRRSDKSRPPVAFVCAFLAIFSCLRQLGRNRESQTPSTIAGLSRSMAILIPWPKPRSTAELSLVTGQPSG